MRIYLPYVLFALAAAFSSASAIIPSYAEQIEARLERHLPRLWKLAERLGAKLARGGSV